MAATAQCARRPIRVKHTIATALSLSAICVFWLSVPSEGRGQESASAARSQGSADADPMATAERLLNDRRPAADDASYGQELIETARAVGRKGELQTALQLLLTALDHYRSGPLAGEHRAILTAQLGITSAAWQLGNHDLVIEQASELLRLPTDGSDGAQRNAARQLLAKSLQQTGRFDRSLEIIGELANGSAAAKGFATEHALVIGGAALRSGQLEVAAEAYRFYLEQAPQGARAAEAVLGIAWAAAMGAEPPERAEEQLAEFVAAYPEHHDVPHALKARVRVLRQLGRDADAQQLALDVIAQYPGSEAAQAVLEDFLLASPPPWPEVIRAGWLERLGRLADTAGGGSRQGEPTETLPTEIIQSLLVGAITHGDDRIWRASLEALLRSDGDGTQSQALFQSLAQDQTIHVAEHLAVDLLGQIIDHQNGQSHTGGDADSARPPLPAACEAACRWAGLMGRWSMLALVADQVRPASEPPDGAKANSRQLAIDRLLAESLMQTRRSHDALPWWDALIDIQGADDFATLLRGAEAAAAHGSPEHAATRLGNATMAAGDDPFSLSLIRILEAELAIRRARLDEARELLSAIVRATDSAAELRPRAQWLVGETYFLQARYADAIDAYRRVDALDAEGQWAAAALLQAGKAFEKLGRSRDAATCYTALLSRFGNSPNAAQARTRLAQIGGAQPGDAPLRR